MGPHHTLTLVSGGVTASLHHTLVSGGVFASFPNSDGVTQATYPSIAAGLRKLLQRAMHGSSEQDGSYTEEEEALDCVRRR
jgi:hypothetical protein